jgi:hypothetical protein
MVNFTADPALYDRRRKRINPAHICALLVLAQLCCQAAAASYCEESARTGEVYCRMAVSSGTPSPDERAQLLDTRSVEYCREDEFDGARKCVLIMEQQAPVDASIEFHRATNGRWLLVAIVYTGDPAPGFESLQVKVDDGPPVFLRGSGGGRSSMGDGDFTVRGLFAADREQLEAISTARNQVWFRFSLEDGSTKDLKMAASHFALLNLFIAEASSAFGER